MLEVAIVVPKLIQLSGAGVLVGQVFFAKLLELGIDGGELLGKIIFALVHLAALDLLHDENKLVGVMLRFSGAKERVLELADSDDFLLVARHVPAVFELVEGVGNDRDHDVEDDDQVAEDAKDEEDPVRESVHQYIIGEVSEDRQK